MVDFFTCMGLIEILWWGEFVACGGHVHLQSMFHAHFMLSVHFVSKKVHIPSPTSQI